jgi:YD repeat-containing protein
MPRFVVLNFLLICALLSGSISSLTASPLQTAQAASAASLSATQPSSPAASGGQNGTYYLITDTSYTLSNYQTWTYTLNPAPYAVRVQSFIATDDLLVRCWIEVQDQDGTWLIGNGDPWNSRQSCKDVRVFHPHQQATIRITLDKYEAYNLHTRIEGYDQIHDQVSGSQIVGNGAWQPLYERTMEIPNYSSAYVHISAPPDRVRVQCFPVSPTPSDRRSFVAAQYDDGSWLLGNPNPWDQWTDCRNLTLLKPVSGDSFTQGFTIRVTNDDGATWKWRIVIEGYNIVHDAVSGASVTTAQSWRTIYDRTVQIPNYSPAYVHVNPPLDRVRIQCFPIAPDTTEANRAFVTAQSDDQSWLLGSADTWVSHIDCKNRTELAPTDGFAQGFTFRVTNDNDATNTWRIVIEGYCETLPTPLPDDQNRVPGEGASCPCQQQRASNVNTRTGNYWTSTTDLAASPALVWARTYANQAVTDTRGELGAGWQHSFAAHLILPGMSGGEPGRVIVFSAKTNKLRFTDQGNGEYRAFPGISSTLIRDGAVYRWTLRDQRQLTFDATSGVLVGVRDAQGRQLALTYSGAPARLTHIAEAADSARFLALTYTANGQIETVSDGARTVRYTYTNGDMTAVSDVMSRTTTYTYQGHLLTKITNPLGQDVVQIGYDVYTAAGKVTSQVRQDGRQIQFVYQADATVMTTIGQNGQPDEHEFSYDQNNTLTGIRTNGRNVLSSQFDAAFNPATATDANGNTTIALYTKNGLLSVQTDALGQQTRMEYDERNRLTQTTDALGGVTQFEYDDANNLLSATTGSASPNGLRATTLYTYTYDVAYSSRLQEQRSPDGIVTRYDYDPLHLQQVINATIGYGTPLGQTTTYDYDQLGRVVTTTVGFGTALARRDVTRYRADNTVEATIQNYQDGVFDPQQPDADIITTYGYDLLGRQVWVRDALGRYAATHYDAAGHVDWTARNLTPLTLDSQGQPLFQSFSPAQPDANVATLYGYDGLGRTEFVTETGILAGGFDPATLQFSAATTRVTRSEYDALSRPVTTTLNYRPGLPAGTDINVRLYTSYDAAGNVVEQVDALGRRTVTRYDALNRPSSVIANYKNGEPWALPSDANLTTAMRYDAVGRVTQQIDNYVDGVFNATQPITDRITLYQYDALSRVVTTTVNYDWTNAFWHTDTNHISVTAYDPATGRALGQRDPLGRWANWQYDVLGRVTTTIQNCRNTQGAAVATGCASFDPATPDRNVPATTHYDALGQAFENVDGLGGVNRSAFDRLGRPLAMTRNYVASAPTTPITNVTTLNVYDALGQTTTMTNALGYATHTAANGLGQTVLVTDTMGRVTRMGYDGTGALR